MLERFVTPWYTSISMMLTGFLLKLVGSFAFGLWPISVGRCLTALMADVSGFTRNHVS